MHGWIPDSCAAHLVADFLTEITTKYLLVLMAKPLPGLLEGCYLCWVSVCSLVTEVPLPMLTLRKD